MFSEHAVRFTRCTKSLVEQHYPDFCAAELHGYERHRVAVCTGLGICTGLGLRQRHNARTSSPPDRRPQRSGSGQQLEPRLRFDPTEQRRAPFSVLRSPQAISAGRHRSALAPVQTNDGSQPWATRRPTAATAGKEHQIIDDIDDYRRHWRCRSDRIIGTG